MKIWNYAIIVTGIAFIFELAGIPVAQNLLNLFGLSRTGVAIQGTALWGAIIGISVAGTLIIGAITRTSPENYLIWPIAVTYFIIFVAPLTGIITTASAYADWIFYIILFISAILIVGFAVALLEFLRGTD